MATMSEGFWLSQEATDKLILDFDTFPISKLKSKL